LLSRQAKRIASGAAREWTVTVMDEERLNRELDELLTILKEAERRAIEDGHIYGVKDIVAIHMAALRGYYDMSDAVEAIKAMYERDGDNE
jgi:hypothetical protein